MIDSELDALQQDELSASQPEAKAKPKPKRVRPVVKPVLIVGLGNPGDRYQQTRHNIGFLVLEAFARRESCSWSLWKAPNNAKASAQVAQGHLNGQKYHLMCPQTYMNLSGEVVQPFSHFYKLPLQQILVVYDDVALPFGKLRIRLKGSAGGHNGMKSIIQQFGQQEDFPRLRIGVGSPPEGYALENYVLGKWLPSEQAVLSQVIDSAVDTLYDTLQNGLEAAMNRANSEKGL